jgi:uncharacterized protein YdeI (YjbR/CyaY-like superfamily)
LGDLAELVSTSYQNNGEKKNVEDGWFDKGFDYAHPRGFHGSTSLTTDHGLGNLYKLLYVMQTDPRIDDYVKKAASFAQPILQHLRLLVHKACPDVQETMKWSFPHFDYKGILCSMAAFKQHCTFGFWKASIMKDPEQILKLVGKTAMGHFDKITSLKDLPSDKIMIAYIKEAVRLNEEGTRIASKEKKPKAEIAMPEEFAIALKRNKKALAAFEQFSQSHKREYLEWITEAKTEATREKRIEKTIEWLTEGKSRNWKYER